MMHAVTVNRAAATLEPAARRDQVIPLPGRTESYRRLLLIGATGSGKSTLVRQLLGMRPGKDRFPATSTSRTTIADTEIIFTNGTKYQTVASFMTGAEIRVALHENVIRAVVTAARGGSEADIANHLLNHINQRYRFSYLLGGYRALLSQNELDGCDRPAYEPAPSALLHPHPELVKQFGRIRGAVKQAAKSYTDRAADDSLADDVRQDPRLNVIIDQYAKIVREHAVKMCRGAVTVDDEGWPVTVAFDATSKTSFLSEVAHVSANSANKFGTLLTPLVNGLRVAGPFHPEWATKNHRVVLLDGEGIGHRTGHAATLTNHIVSTMNRADAVLLVDNCTQPMPTSTVAALKCIELSGQTKKLNFIFTHFDGVEGPNMTSIADRRQHVLAAAENAIAAIGEDLGTSVAARLERRLHESNAFLSDLHETITPRTTAGDRALVDLKKVLATGETKERNLAQDGSYPIYSPDHLWKAIFAATTAFNHQWQAYLGITDDKRYPAAHWPAVRSVANHLAIGNVNANTQLDPVADMRGHLQEQLYVMLQNPLSWSSGVPSDDVIQARMEAANEAFSAGLAQSVEDALVHAAQQEWAEAAAFQGKGSTIQRRDFIAAKIIAVRAPTHPVPADAPEHLLTHVAKAMQVVLDNCVLDFAKPESS